ncbi:MAG: NUDIX domain-containing protein [Planctomycetes bacterium]|nr:NUDIX domain-containing protein [Planctomycetota bacterium]MCW8134247.1 NUDIX domain-containing protein [Planctomycetota bacterium]
MADRPLVGARAIVLHRGYVLLLRGEEPGRVYWFLPGGMVRHGESLRQACEREVLEETGVRVRAGPMVYLREFIASRHKRITRGMPPNHHVVAGVFLCEVTGDGADREPGQLGTFVADRNAKGVTGMAWVKLAEVEGLEIHPPQLKSALLAGLAGDTPLQFWPEE